MTKLNSINQVAKKLKNNKKITKKLNITCTLIKNGTITQLDWMNWTAKKLNKTKKIRKKTHKKSKFQKK